MPKIEVRCRVPLPSPIVLSIHDSWDYPHIALELENGDYARVNLEVKSQDIQTFGDKLHDADWWVNSTVEAVHLTFQIAEVSREDYRALNKASIERDEFGFRSETFQFASQVGERVKDDVRETLNPILNRIRTTYGQFWLRMIDLPSSTGDFCSSCRCEWRDPGGKWSVFMTEPGEISMQMVIGGADEYLRTGDWTDIGSQISGRTPLQQCYALATESRARFHSGDKEIAVIQLNSALELAAQRFIDLELREFVPEKSLAEILNQSHARLLENWVLPLIQRQGLAIDNQAWQNVQRVRVLRKRAAHPGESTEFTRLTLAEFTRLARSSICTISELLRLDPPRMPAFRAGLSAGSVATERH